MRYDLTDFEWDVIEPVLPKGRPGPRPKNNRRVLNGIFWVLRAGAPWRDLPSRYGPYTTAYNRFNRWRKAGVWDRLMDAVAKAHDGKRPPGPPPDLAGTGHPEQDLARSALPRERGHWRQSSPFMGAQPSPAAMQALGPFARTVSRSSQRHRSTSRTTS